MADKPMLFSTPMVRALLEGRKVQTRRIIKPEPDSSKMREGSYLRIVGAGAVRQVENHFRPRWLRGDRIWVRESWRPIGDAPLSECTGPSDIMFAATATDDEFGTFSFKPSIHMPRWASRLTLAVTDMKVERLQDISEADAEAEGVTYETADPGFYYVPGIWPHSITAVGVEERNPAPAAASYAKLWEHINGKGSWDANPFVVAITFDVHKTNIDQMEAP